MKKVIVFLFFQILILNLMAQDKPAYVIFDKEGEPVRYADMMKDLTRGQVVFFGELHNNPICHWLQLELTKDLHRVHEERLVLGAEMFEADNQLILDEYLKEFISEKKFEKECRLWPNYKTDYKPLVEYAKENNMNFVATNIPRRYASRVFNEGLESLEDLSDEAKKYIAPLPVEVDMTLPGYQNMLEMAGGAEHASLNFPHAQAIKDATMAHFILKHIKNKRFLHYNGAYHSDNFEGIVHYLKKENKRLEVLTISSVEQENLRQLEEEYKGKADYIICIDSNMTKTY